MKIGLTSDAEWEQRRGELRECEWRCSQRLFGMAETIMKRLEAEECKAKEDTQNVLKVAESASKLGRLSLGGAETTVELGSRDEIGKELEAMITKIAKSMEQANGGAL